MTLRLRPMWLASALVATVAAMGWGMWSMRVQDLNQDITKQRAVLRTLNVGDQLVPSEDVAAYLKARVEAFEMQYQKALTWLTASLQPVGEATDPQVLFQQRVHEVTGVIERAAKARGMAVPTLLGLPKELPPPDAVPRFLVQIGLTQEAAERVLAIREVSQVSSFKFEDPHLDDAESDDPFLMVQPVRVRWRCSLEALALSLNALAHVKPAIEVQHVRVATVSDAPDELEVDALLVRYMVASALGERAQAPAATTKHTR